MINTTQEPIPITEHIWTEDTVQLVSISTLCYNHVKYIRDAIEGFLMQKTTFPVKIVIFDDCSTDGTQEILREYQNKYPYLFHITFAKENTYKKPTRREALKPRNKERSKGKYIALCEGDDYWTDPLKLQKQVDFLEENPEYVLSCHNYKILDFDGKKLKNEYEYEFVKDREEIEIDEEIYLSHWITKTLTVVLRNEPKIFKENSIIKNQRDLSLFYTYIKNGKGIFHNFYGAVYRQQKGGVYSSQNKLQAEQETLRIIEELYSIYKTEPLFNRMQLLKFSTIYFEYISDPKQIKVPLKRILDLKINHRQKIKLILSLYYHKLKKIIK